MQNVREKSKYEDDPYVKSIKTFVWYDLETFGINPARDRIAQFACVRTDRDFNQIGEPVVLFCKPPYDYLPCTEAILKTGITPLQVAKKGISEDELITQVNEIFSEPGTCICGFNSTVFDDEFIRYALYRNFIDPYRWSWFNGCSTLDVLTLLRACHDLRPEGISWITNPETGRPILRLEELTRANGISHEHAHDALSDVFATISMARLVREKQPELFNYYLKYKFKDNAIKLFHLEKLPEGMKIERKVLLFQDFRFSSKFGLSTMLFPLYRDKTDKNLIYCFNLACNTYPLLKEVKGDDLFDDKEIGEDGPAGKEGAGSADSGIVTEGVAVRSVDFGTDASSVASDSAAGSATSGSGSDTSTAADAPSYNSIDSIPGIIRIKINKAGFFSPVSVLTKDSDYERLGLDKELCFSRAKRLEKNLDLINLFVSNKLSESSKGGGFEEDPDFSLYGGFASNLDSNLFTAIKNTSPSKRIDLKLVFDNPKYSEMLFRHVCRSYPAFVKGENLVKWKKRIRDCYLGELPTLYQDDIHPKNVYELKAKLDKIIGDSESSKEDKKACEETKEYLKKICEYVEIEWKD